MIRASDWNNRYGRPRRRRRRHGCLTRLVTTVVVLAVLVGFFWWQQNGLSSETLSVPAAPDGFAGTRIAVVSDLHGKEFGEDNERLLAYIRDLEPDCIAVVGDLLHEEAQLAMVPAVARGLAAIAPTYYVTGNHEWAAGVAPQLEELLTDYGVTVLSNEYVMLEQGGDRIALVGAEDPNGYADQPTVAQLLDQVRAEQGAVYTILLSHRNNHYAQYAEARGANAKNLLLSTVEGVGLGALGIGLPDIVLFVGMLLKGIYETALRYGFPYEDPAEQMWILRMMETALTKGPLWTEKNQGVDAFLYQGLMEEPTKEALSQQIQATAQTFAMDMLVLKFIQGLPLVGALGGAANPVYYRRVLNYVQLKYHKRYLYQKRREMAP